MVDVRLSKAQCVGWGEPREPQQTSPGRHRATAHAKREPSHLGGHENPELGLIAAVLGAALREATEPARAYTRTDTRHAAANARAQAQAWIASDSCTPWSYRWCCDHCGADPAQVRALLAADAPALHRRLHQTLRRTYSQEVA